MNQEADPGLEEHLRIVTEVNRMRRTLMYVTLSLAALGALAFCAFTLWLNADLWLMALLVVGICLIFWIVLAQFEMPACPSCRHRLTASGKYSVGTLDKPRCIACGVSFELNQR